MIDILQLTAFLGVGQFSPVRVYIGANSSLLEALAGDRSLLSALQAIQRRMRSGCQLNKREKHPNAAQLLRSGSTNWALSP